MSLFKNLFGGKKEDPKPFSRTPLDLDLGYIFEYDMQSWEVMAVYEYDWGDEDFSKEFKVSDGQNTYYLSVEDDDEIEMTWSKKIPLRSIEGPIAQQIEEDERPPETIVYESRTYYLDEESAGYFHEKGSDENAWAEFMVWDYYDKKEEYQLSIEQWGPRSFEASHGKVLKSYEISDILPREQ
ncbi:DUF4178 domain-containing protein [Croceimicrobium sp.]|uniref:DUF4178 domain-containing protein n=1 Tax=Croceimicrobium sp. TaxID=2828340 RepID=UPI003BA94453